MGREAATTDACGAALEMTESTVAGHSGRVDRVKDWRRPGAMVKMSLLLGMTVTLEYLSGVVISCGAVITVGGVLSAVLTEQADKT